jgi:hypothetical protein
MDTKRYDADRDLLPGVRRAWRPRGAPPYRAHLVHENLLLKIVFAEARITSGKTVQSSPTAAGDL